jgi:hypothetical protein
MDEGTTRTLKDIKTGRTRNTAKKLTIKCTNEIKITVKRTIVIMTS